MKSICQFFLSTFLLGENSAMPDSIRRLAEVDDAPQKELFELSKVD